MKKESNIGKAKVESGVRTGGLRTGDTRTGRVGAIRVLGGAGVRTSADGTGATVKGRSEVKVEQRKVDTTVKTYHQFQGVTKNSGVITIKPGCVLRWAGAQDGEMVENWKAAADVNVSGFGTIWAKLTLGIENVSSQEVGLTCTGTVDVIDTGSGTPETLNITVTGTANVLCSRVVATGVDSYTTEAPSVGEDGYLTMAPGYLYVPILDFATGTDNMPYVSLQHVDSYISFNETILDPS